MAHFLPLRLAPVLLLVACQPSSGEIASRSRATVTAAAPLVERCRAEFVRSLGRLPVTVADGPTITDWGDRITIRLEAQPTDPTILDARLYSCDFEQGQMTRHGPA